MKKFKHKKTGEIATYKDGVLKSSGFCVEIGVEPSSEFWEEIVEKVKTPLFTTEDGVDIYEGDKLFTVEKGFYFIQEIKASKNTEELFKRRLFFSTKEAAQEFIILNKPCLSYNDVTKNLEAFKNNKFILKELKELVKSKL